MYISFDNGELILDWGDFFFLVDQSLTFDGVFEMAPHPMYLPQLNYLMIGTLWAMPSTMYIQVSFA